MSIKDEEIKAKSDKKIGQKQLFAVFDLTKDKLSILINNLNDQEINASFIKTRFQQIFTTYQLAFEEAFKPKGYPENLSQEVLSSSFFKQGKIEIFTFKFLSNLLTAFQERVAEALAIYNNDASAKHDLLGALARFQKLLTVIADIYIGKLSSGTQFIDDFNHMLLTINDTTLITELITDYSLGTKDSKVQEFLNKHDLALEIQNSITALDHTLKNNDLESSLQAASQQPKL